MTTAKDDSTAQRRITPSIIVGVVTIVFVLLIARWLTTPFDDWVPLTPHHELPSGVVADDLPDAAHFECASVLGSSRAASATDQATDALTHQDLTRGPCAELRTQRKVVGAVDIVIGLAVLVGLLVLRRRRLPPPLVTRSETASA